MDWSKSKSIFIIVFLILDIFLYSLYLNRLTEAQKVEVLGEKTIEARLSDDQITYSTLPEIENAPYFSGSVKTLDEENFPSLNNQDISIENESKIIATMNKPVPLRDIEDTTSYVEFLQTYVVEGSNYTLWNVDLENRTATFFQRVDERTIYYNINGMVKLYWNNENEVYMYEQTLLENLEEFEEQESLWTPIQVIQVLYANGLLKPGSQITQVKLGYSTLVQLTQTQVFVPTWEIRVTTADGIEEEYFVNAVEGLIIDVQLEQKNVEDEDE
nr:two-component system regulatory protein YycI [Lysinibacillus timonensis]